MDKMVSIFGFFHSRHFDYLEWSKWPKMEHNNNVEFQKYFQCIDVLFLFDILSLVKLLSVLYILSFALENNRLKSNIVNNALHLKKKIFKTPINLLLYATVGTL